MDMEEAKQAIRDGAREAYEFVGGHHPDLTDEHRRLMAEYERGLATLEDVMEARR